MKNMYFYNTSSESERWRKLTKYHQRCCHKYKSLKPLNNIQKYIDQYNESGFFSYHDEETEALSRSIYNKLKEDGFVDAVIPIDMNESDNRYSVNRARQMSTYSKDAYLEFPEIEVFFKGVVGDIVRGILGCNFDIFYSRIHKSSNFMGDKPEGSQLWHTDGGPSNCIILFLHLTDVGEHNGSTEIIPWKITKKILRKTYFESYNQIDGKKINKMESRYIKSCVFAKEIAINHTKDVMMCSHEMPGLVSAMNNNNLHKGGFTYPDQTRLILMTHLYPIDKSTPFEKYRKCGTPKTSPYPKY